MEGGNELPPGFRYWYIQSEDRGLRNLRLSGRNCRYFMTSRTVSGNPTAAQSYEMDAITAVIIGGVSMSGGSGKWYGTVIGALLISIIANALDILNVSSHYQPVIKGLIIIFAVLLDMKTKIGKIEFRFSNNIF